MDASRNRYARNSRDANNSREASNSMNGPTTTSTSILAGTQETLGHFTTVRKTTTA
jgi:hypothetical protein